MKNEDNKYSKRKVYSDLGKYYEKNGENRCSNLVLILTITLCFTGEKIED